MRDDWNIGLWTYKPSSLLREILQIRACDERGNTVRGRDSAYHARVRASGRSARWHVLGYFFFLEKSKSPTIRSGRRGPWGTGSRGIGKGWRRYRWTMVEAAASILSSPLSPSSSSTTLSSSGRLLHVAIAYSQPCHYHEAILHAG